MFTDMNLRPCDIPGLHHPDMPVVHWHWRAWKRARRLAYRALVAGRIDLARVLECRSRERRREMHSWLIQIGVR